MKKLFEILKALGKPKKMFRLKVSLNVTDYVYVKDVILMDVVAEQFCIDLEARGITAIYLANSESIWVHNFKPCQETLLHLLITEYGETYYLEAKKTGSSHYSDVW